MNSISNNFFLVTTADEQSWPEKGNILFLGEWCKRYSRETIWSNYEFKVLSYHWDDRNKLESDFKYLHYLHEKLLEQISIDLNKFHNCNHNSLYWRIIIGPWLGTFTQIIFDRWSSLSQALIEYQINNTIIINYSQHNFVPNDLNHFMKLYIRDDWNHYIYSKIILELDQIDYDVINANEIINTYDEKLRGVNKIKNFFIKIAAQILRVLQKEDDSIIATTYLGVWNELKLYFRLKQFPQIRSSIINQDAQLKYDKRDWSFNFIPSNEFETVLVKLISSEIPKIYFEGFQNLIQSTISLKWPNNPKYIFTSNRHLTDDLFNTYTAQKIESGTRLLIGQHGGHYRSSKFFFSENHEFEISTYFLTWGWKIKGNHKILPVGFFKKINKLKNYDLNKTSKLLLIEYGIPRQSYHLFSSPISSQFLNYLDDQFTFVNHLSDSLKGNLVVRLYPTDYGWDTFLRWKNLFPKINVDTGPSRIDKYFLESRICVSTYNATTFLETISLDIPTVMFWDFNYWEVCEAAVFHYEKLQSVGILHSSPESAARHVMLIWDNVGLWWNSAEVRKVINEFKNEYCNTTTYKIDNIAAIFNY